MSDIAGVDIVEQETVSITLGETDGFRYFDFHPPIDRVKIIDFPLPVMDITEGRAGVWYPTSIDTELSTGRIARIGFFSDSFEGEVQTQESYAQVIAEYIGNAVVVGLD